MIDHEPYPSEANAPVGLLEHEPAPIESAGILDDASPSREAAETTPAPAAAPVPLASDSLAEGMMLLAVLTVVQRLVGFVRSILFCRWLSEDALGQWDLAFGFFILAAPLAVLGLPGSFGRYVERFRQAGQLAGMIKGTMLVTACLTVAASLAIGLAPGWFAEVVFNHAEQAPLMQLVGLGLVAVIGFNFLVELVTGLRQVRVASAMQFANGILFATCGLGLILLTGNGAAAVVGGYALACGITAVGTTIWLSGQWNQLPADERSLDWSELATTLLPFAIWVWMTNLLANTFDLVDRYMIVHLSSLEASAAEGIVGQYHAARVLPQLLVQLAGMIGGMLLPYLSQDWEKGNIGVVSRRVNLAVKIGSLLLTLAGAGILILAPLLFDGIYQGRYALGYAVLPTTLVSCSWGALSLLAMNFLWCAERARLSSFAFLVGIVLNAVLNYYLFPIWGLPGVVLATALGNGASLLMLLMLGMPLGLSIPRGTWLLIGLPMALAAGWIGGLSAVAVAGFVLWKTDWLLDDEERTELLGAARGALKKVGFVV